MERSAGFLPTDADICDVYSLDVDNVFLYVADAVRWDFAPDAILNRGHASKTVTAGIHSPTSIASLLSGTALPQHHVADFSDALPDAVPNLLRAPSLSTAFINSINDVRFDPSDESLIANVLNTVTSAPDILSSIEPPFFVFERGPGGHAPYGGFDGDGWEYFQDRAGAARFRFADDYRTAVDEDTDWFQSRLAVLDERGLLEDTLVIYTSDHGELLGETGRVGHKPPIRPEHVYVPTVFIHRDLDPETTTNPVYSHLDIAPTIASLLDIDLDTAVPTVGRDLTVESPTGVATTFHTYRLETPVGTLEIPFESVWSTAGGYVFPRRGPVRRLLLGGHHLARMPWRRYARDNGGSFLWAYLRGASVYGAPELSRTEADDHLATVAAQASAERQEAPEAARESLRQLGYLE